MKLESLAPTLKPLLRTQYPECEPRVDFADDRLDVTLTWGKAEARMGCGASLLAREVEPLGVTGALKLLFARLGESNPPEGKVVKP